MKTKKEGQGCYLGKPKKAITAFKQDCLKCEKFIKRIRSNGQLVPNKELGKRVSLAMRCFFFRANGQPKKIACFKSNLCHVVLEQVGIVVNKQAGLVKEKIF